MLLPSCQVVWLREDKLSVGRLDRRSQLLLMR